MPKRDDEGLLEEQIGQWRSYLRRRQAIQPVDAEELEDHLREHVASLIAAGLSADEAFLVAVKRLGELDALSREFAREHSERLWKQLVLVSTEAAAAGAPPPAPPPGAPRPSPRRSSPPPSPLPPAVAPPRCLPRCPCRSRSGSSSG